MFDKDAINPGYAESPEGFNLLSHNPITVLLSMKCLQGLPLLAVLAILAVLANMGPWDVKMGLGRAWCFCLQEGDVFSFQHSVCRAVAFWDPTLQDRDSMYICMCMYI